LEEREQEELLAELFPANLSVVAWEFVESA
jgi:hypothetical protein